MGLTAIKAEKPTKQEAAIAKNYLNADELNILNRMVTAYLEVAELQALNRTPMYMADWVERLDGFLTMTGNNILQNAGSISHQEALDKANAEYQRYKEAHKNQISKVEKDYLHHIDATAKQLKNKKK